MRFSASVFSSSSIAAMIARSSCAFAPRGVVPFIGWVSMKPSPSTEKNSSGERDRITGPPRSTSAPYLTGWRATNDQKAVSGSPLQRA
ncbi:hypothetical protein D3C71_1187210 [compost metagenome]